MKKYFLFVLLILGGAGISSAVAETVSAPQAKHGKHHPKKHARHHAKHYAKHHVKHRGHK